MNYLDILPVDVSKIINRKVQDAHIIERRIQRKRNREINKKQKEISERRKHIFEKFATLYNVHLREEYGKKVESQYKYCQELVNEIKTKYQKTLINTELVVGGDKAQVIATFFTFGKYQQVIFE